MLAIRIFPIFLFATLRYNSYTMIKIKGFILKLLLGHYFPIFYLFTFTLPAFATTIDPGNLALSEFFPLHNGKKIEKIDIFGLTRSKSTMVQWMLGGHEGELFDAEKWRDGISRLYSTQSLYDIHTEFQPIPCETGECVRIHLNLKDQWTLLPYAYAQGGGGSFDMIAGVFENNLAGRFIYIALEAEYLDKSYSYNVEFSQKWIMGSTFSVGAKFSDKRTPVDIANKDGQNVGPFVWRRKQESFFLGKHASDDFYLELGFRYFKDSLFKGPSTAEANIYRQQQFSLAPSLKVGKMGHNEYLELGHELTLKTSVANPFKKDLTYETGEISWKHLIYLPGNRNFGYFLSSGVMGDAPLAYRFHLGGFDSVRGFDANRAIGSTYARGNIEFRDYLGSLKVPLFELDRVIFQDVAFFDSGKVWSIGFQDPGTRIFSQGGDLFLASAGIGIRAFFVRFSGATARLDFAKTITPTEGFGISFGAEQFF